MSEMVSQVLFESRSREALLRLLLLKNVEAPVSELARRAGLSARAISREVQHLLPTGLLNTTTVGGADVVTVNRGHAAAKHLAALLQIPAEPASAGEDRSTRASLAAWGAPLVAAEGRRAKSLEAALLAGLELSRRDGTVLRVMPTVLARNAARVDWQELEEGARRRKLKSELGWLLEQTAELANEPALARRGEKLRDRRRRSVRCFPEVKSRFERELAHQRSPPIARRWGFAMNVSVESLRSTFERHRA